MSLSGCLISLKSHSDKFVKISMGSTLYSTIEKSIFFEPIRIRRLEIATFVHGVCLELTERIALQKIKDFLAFRVLTIFGIINL